MAHDVDAHRRHFQRQAVAGRSDVGGWDVVEGGDGDGSGGGKP